MTWRAMSRNGVMTGLSTILGKRRQRIPGELRLVYTASSAMGILPIGRPVCGRPDGVGTTGLAVPFYGEAARSVSGALEQRHNARYWTGLDKEKALLEIKKSAGKQFDTHLTDVFISLMSEHGQKECSMLPTCEIFKRIERQEVSSAYKEQFCHGLHLYCARYKHKDKENVPSDLLPDGSLLR